MRLSIPQESNPEIPRLAALEAGRLIPVGSFDFRNRTGIAMILRRQFILEALVNERFADPPRALSGGERKDVDERRCIDQLARNERFMELYGSFDWSRAGTSVK